MRALTVHGIGHRTPSTFSAKAMKWLGGALSRKGVPLKYGAVHYGPLLDSFQDRMAREVEARGSSGRPLQSVGIGTLADALSYRNVQGSINHLAGYELRALGGVDVVFAHSLGCVIATDWLRQLPLTNPVTLVTFGCNLEIFNLGAEGDFQVPRCVTRWFNLFSPTDALGWPIRGWIPMAQDFEVKVGGVFTRWWGASHAAYWTDKKFWSETVPSLLHP